MLLLVRKLVVSWIIDRLNVGDVREFWIVARSNATGNWTNVVDVNSAENVTVVDSNVTVDVRPVNLTVVKTANVTVVGNNTLVNFTIVVIKMYCLVNLHSLMQLRVIPEVVN